MTNFGDEIMMLEGFNQYSNEVTEKDILTALFDFPEKDSESLLSGAFSFEDSIDFISAPAALSALELPPHPHRPHRPRPYPVPYPVNYGPAYTEVLPVSTIATVESDPITIQRIRALEKKLKELFPDKVKLLNAGIEGLEAVPEVSSVANAIKIAAAHKAASSPGSKVASSIVSNLSKKESDLNKLAKDRRNLAQKALQSIKSDKATIERLERVARSKASQVINTALSSQKNDPAIASKMDSLITDIKRLHDRSILLGKKALDNAKLYGAATVLARNASGQSSLTKGLRTSIQQGNPEQAKALAAGLAKHTEIAKAIKNVRLKQREMWSGQSKEAVMQRLAGRGERFLKAISLIGKKAQQAGLSQEDMRNLRNAHAQYYAARIGMMSVKPGKIFPAEITKAAGLSDSSPVFSMKVHPNDPSGALLEAIREAKFSVETPDRNKIAWMQEDMNPFIYAYSERFRGLEAIREAKFSVETPDRNKIAWMQEDMNPFIYAYSVRFRGLGNLVSDTSSLGQITGKMIKKADEVLRAGRQINAVSAISSMDWNAIKGMSPLALQNLSRTLKTGANGISGELMKKSKSIVRYVNSPANSVCRMASNIPVSSKKYIGRICGSSLGQISIPKSYYLRTVPASKTGFPNIPEAVRIKKSLESFPGFPAIYSPIREKGSIEGIPGFPDIPAAVRIRKMDLIEGAALAAPVLLV